MHVFLQRTSLASPRLLPGPLKCVDSDNIMMFVFIVFESQIDQMPSGSEKKSLDE